MADEDLSKAINSIPPTVFWMMGKGRIRANEPLYGVQLLDPESGVAVAWAESESLVGHQHRCREARSLSNTHHPIDRREK